MSKTFILDTNVLLHNPESIFSFKDNKVAIPIDVIEEMDNFKKDRDEKGKNARQVAREIDSLRGKGILKDGATLKNGGKLQIVIKYDIEMPEHLNPSSKDNKILLAALSLKKKGENVIFVSKDLNARIKADVLGIETQDYEEQKVVFDELYTGHDTIKLTANQINEIKTSGEMKLGGDFLENQYLKLVDKKDEENYCLGKYSIENSIVTLIKNEKPDMWGIEPRNTEQIYACDALLDKNISLVTLIGQAGTGKTLLAIAAGLRETVDNRVYRNLLVSRPIMPMGKDIGYLPGDKDEKLFFWMQPIFDNLRFIFSKSKSINKKEIDKEIKMLIDQNSIELEALTYIRGRSIPEQYIIIDEAQNLTPHEIKTIISRAGEGSKVVLTGDPYQIDNPYLDSNSNGLCYIVERFKNQPSYAHISFVKSERSKLASLAAELL